MRFDAAYREAFDTVINYYFLLFIKSGFNWSKMSATDNIIFIFFFGDTVSHKMKEVN